MYDYMKALQKRFDHQSHPELDTQIEYVREELRRDMDATERKKLLHLLDAQNALLTESTLMSFTAGFKLAAGIAGELGAPYSYDTDEEQTAQDAHSKDYKRTISGMVFSPVRVLVIADHMTKPSQATCLRRFCLYIV